MKIELNKDECQATLSLIDIAVKSAGLQVAQVASILAEKFATAIKELNEEADSRPDPAQ